MLSKYFENCLCHNLSVSQISSVGTVCLSVYANPTHPICLLFCYIYARLDLLNADGVQCHVIK